MDYYYSLSWYNEGCTPDLQLKLTQGVPPWGIINEIVHIINEIVQCACTVRINEIVHIINEIVQWRNSLGRQPETNYFIGVA